MQLSRICRWLAVAACLVAQPVLAAGPAPSAVDPTLALLQKIQGAARQLDYAGVFTYQQGPVLQSTRIVHMVDGTGERERLEMLDGAPGEFLRHNDNIERLVPEHKIVVLETLRADRFPGLLITDGRNIPAYYSVIKNKRPHRVAGRECVMIELMPKDHDRYGHRYCSDTKTDLLLKSQTLGPGGGVIDQISFTNLKVGESVQPSQLEPHWNTKGWKVLEAPMRPIDLAKMGWRISVPAGFVDVTQVQRPMKAGKQVNQLVLSDGLAAISVFIEPFDKAHEQALPKGAVRKGALNIYGTRIGDHWFTVVGEVPVRTLRDIAKRTEYVPLASSR
ncbi:MAG TPA: MucB/RseB C-terminal domain-containing protein [Burkholderiaceae bacterium]|nr:MucB/RseB C-terminal domain-containing protein [Burkholderiaceae bacterium]